MAREVPAKFLVAFSFAGEQRELVRRVAEALEVALGEGTVFYDDWFVHYIAGFDGDKKLREIYTKRAELVVVCISRRYGDKSWTQMEYEVIQARVMTARTSSDKTDRLRILPLRFGDGDVEGISFNTIVPDVRADAPEQTARLIIDRLRLAQRRIYLATCPEDLSPERERMRACLEDLGWSILPVADQPEGEIRERWRENLKDSLAFVQLLGPTPWQGEAFDRIQNDAAVDLGLPRFRYRSSEIDLASVPPPQAEVLTDKSVIATGFEDFKTFVEKELRVLQLRLVRRPRPTPGGDEPPLIRVVIRSPNPDPLWEKAFEWIYDQQRMRPLQIVDGETLEASHLAEPCHGFLVVCDAAALDDGPHSPRRDMEECRQIQLREKNPDRRPPVGIVYWPPPQAPWAKLLRSFPQKLHRVVGDAPEGLREFFADVRRAGAW